MAMHVTSSEQLNVLGMNFLSSLKRWGVEGRWLVLVP
jgi:aspartyl protease family protein